MFSLPRRVRQSNRNVLPTTAWARGQCNTTDIASPNTCGNVKANPRQDDAWLNPTYTNTISNDNERKKKRKKGVKEEEWEKRTWTKTWLTSISYFISISSGVEEEEEGERNFRELIFGERRGLGCMRGEPINISLTGRELEHVLELKNVGEGERRRVPSRKPGCFLSFLLPSALFPPSIRKKEKREKEKKRRKKEIHLQPTNFSFSFKNRNKKRKIFEKREWKNKSF